MQKIILVIVTIIIVLSALLLNFNNILKISYRKDYSEYVEEYSKENDLDPNLVYAIIKAESNFKEDSVSNKGATGLMQLMDETAKEVATNEVIGYETGVTLYNPEKNIQIGTKYYAELKNIFSNDPVALAAYNAGMGTVKKWIDEGIIKSDGSDIENIPYKDTNMYVRKILRDYQIYQKIY